MAFYDLFDDVVCISLRNRADRRSHALAQAGRLGIPLRFHIVDGHPRGSVVGIYTSHMELIRDAYHRGRQRILIFEDDFVTTPAYSKDILKGLADFVTSPTAWDRLQLGYVPADLTRMLDYIFLSPRVHPWVVRFSGLTTHAYCLSRSGMSKILKEAHSGVEHVDWFFMRVLKDTSYCAVPMLFDQKWKTMGSDNEVTQLEKYIPDARGFAERTRIFYRLSQLPDSRTTIILSLLLILILAVLPLRKGTGSSRAERGVLCDLSTGCSPWRSSSS
jgi:glycosyl transferase family 25